MALRIGFRCVSLISMATVLLQGCSQFAPQPPGMPKVDDLLTFNQEMVKFETEMAKLNHRDKTELVKLGYAYSDKQCDEFFILLQKERNKNNYDAGELAALNSFVTPGMTLLHAGAKAVGITGGLFGFGTATFLNYGKIMLLMEYNGELQDLVHGAQTSYKIQANTLLNSSLSIYDAYSIIGGYAWLCTLPGIDSLAHIALSTGAQATTAAPPPPAPAPRSRTGRAPRSLAVPAPPPLAAPAPPPLSGRRARALGPPADSNPSVLIPRVRVER